MEQNQYLAPVLLALVVALVLFTQHMERAKLTREAGVAVAQGGAWLLGYDVPIVDPGILWAMNLMNEKYCSYDPILATEIQKRFTPFLSKQVEQAYARLLDEKDSRPISYELLRTRRTTFDDILVPALYCDITPMPELVHNKILAGEGKSGYTLTHSYLALQFMRMRDCADTSDEDAEKRMAERIAQEETQSSFDDIYAERVAFLEYGGRADLVKPSWISNIILHQEVDGGWRAGVGSYLGPEENPHTTVLALWALAAFTKKCPFK